jgi:hypothetical protein
MAYPAFGTILLFDVHPVTGVSIEVFYADRLATFGRRGIGWFWWPRQRGFAPNRPGRWALSTLLSHEDVPKMLAVLPYCFNRDGAWKQRFR